ncbi:MAG: tetratricopeptide repeat protein [Opitutus sp.]|nr:tetratricopeptide repeat protein [Opitutus sp.]
MRLPGALPTPQFVEQMKRLLDAPKKSTTATRSSGAAVSASPSRSGIPPWVWAAAVVVIGGGATFIATRPSTKEPAPPTASAKPAAAPASEARQLVAKARALYEPWGLTSSEDLALAEQLLKKAVDLDPADSEAWASQAMLSYLQVVTNRDVSEARKAAARSSAKRAIKLAPDLPLARFAYAFSLRFRPESQDEAIRLLRDEAARQPMNRMIVQTLGAALRNVGQLEQSLIYFDKAAAIPGNDPLLHYNRAQSLERLGRFAEAEAEVDEALALAPLYRSVIGIKIRLLLGVRGDLPGARQLLGRRPKDFIISDDAFAISAGVVWLYFREPAKCLDALRPASDYIPIFPGNGPKAYLTGLARRMAGNAEAARSDWSAALQVVDRKLTTEPNSSELQLHKAVVLATLGERNEAESLLLEIVQRAKMGDGSRFAEIGLAKVYTQLEKPDQAIEALESAIKHSDFPTAFRNPLRYSPEWDALRGNPRFEALLKVPGVEKVSERPGGKALPATSLPLVDLAVSPALVGGRSRDGSMGSNPCKAHHRRGRRLGLMASSARPECRPPNPHSA